MQDLIDLDVATHDPSVSPQLRRRLTLMRQRREQDVPGVPVSVAAHLLGLSERTARDWLARARSTRCRVRSPHGCRHHHWPRCFLRLNACGS